MNSALSVAGVFVLCVHVVACGNQQQGLADPSRSANVAGRDSNGSHVQSATGHVEFIGRQGAENRYSFSAIKRVQPATGETEIQGELQYQSFRPDGGVVDAHGDVICVDIVNNVARVGVAAKHVTGVPEGTPAFGYFTVVDNGEGNDAGDLASNLFAAPEATVLQHCASGHVPPPPLFEDLVGNIQVRP